MKAKRTEPVISIHLKGLAQTRVFHPGDTISGVVEIQPDGPLRARKVVIRVGWHTEGKGDRDEHAVQSWDIPIDGDIMPDEPIIEHFDVTLPNSPWSFYGHFVNIVWAVEVKIDIPWATDINHSLEFSLQPLEQV